MLLLPIETITRELDYKLILGVSYAARAGGALLGRHDVLLRMISMVGPGVYMGKNVVVIPSSSPANPARYRRLKQHRFSLLHLDEEGAVFPNGTSLPDALDHRLDGSLLRSDDAILTWGRQQAAHYQQRDTKAHVSVTGQPRFDLTKPASPWWREDAELLTNRYGRYVLVNTNLSTALPAEGVGSWFRSGLVRGRGSDGVSVSSHDRALFASQLEVFSRLIRLVEDLSESGLCDTVILRPHPSENMGAYQAMFAGLQNTVVNRDGPAGPWIKGAAVIAHTACTTAIEAGLAEKPVVGLAFDDRGLGSAITFSFGTTCLTPEDALAAIADALNGEGAGSPDVEPTLTELIANADPSFDSFAACGSAIEQALELTPGGRRPETARRLRAWLRAEDLGDTARRARHATLRQRRTEFLAYRARFPGLDALAMHGLLLRASCLLDVDVRGRVLGSNAILLEAGA